MGFTYTVQGTISRSGGGAADGMTVNLVSTTEGVVDTDVTDGTGDYVVTADSAVVESGDLYVDPVGDAHYSDPGTGPTRSWDRQADVIHDDDFTVTYSNDNPTRGAIGDVAYDSNTGNQIESASMGDPDGDPLTPVKESGPSWGTLSKFNESTFRWTFDTDVPASGDYTFSYHIEDDQGGSSTTETFTVTIDTGDEPPVIDPLPDVTYMQGTGTRSDQSIVATDPDGPDSNLTYTNESGLSWVNVGPSTGTIHYITDDAPVGDHIVQVGASDGQTTSIEDQRVTILAGGLFGLF